MKHIKLSNLSLKNFKGARDTHISFADRTEVSGANATGKTTLVDGFMWVLFDKDSQGNSNFLIRPKDESGRDIDNIEIEVSATMDVDGESITLTKTQKQKWVKKRGAETQTFEGNVNEYQINGFPAKKAEYEAKIRDIIDENLFQMLANPRTFASLKWQEQRKILLEFVSGISDADILRTDERYDPIASDVLAAGMDKAREKAQSALKTLKKMQAEFPVRIDEARNALTETASREDISARQTQASKELEAIGKERDGLSASLDKVTEIQKQIYQLRMEAIDIVNAAQLADNERKRVMRKEYDDAFAKLVETESKRDRLCDRIASEKKSLEENNAEMETLKSQYRAVRSRALPADEKNCPTCGREFPEDKIAEIEQEFNQRKSRDLQRIDLKGKLLRKEIDELTASIEAHETELETLTDAVETADVRYKEAKQAANAFTETDAYASDAYIAKQDAIKALEANLAAMDNGGTYRQELLEREKAALQALKDANEDLYAVEANQRVMERVDALAAEQRECGQRVADQERIVFLLEEFNRQKMDMLSGKINERFKYVRFKLFEQQINGAIKETCVMQVNSNGSYVDYNSANNAARIAGGLDVIDALSELYEVTAPIFIDNAEAVNDANIPEMKAQTVLLKVSEDKKLVVR